MLDVKGLGIRFGGNHAVQNVTASIEAGKITAIIGPNGAGKSTFFNLISGFYQPTSGSIEFLGQDITRLPTHDVVGRGIARTFQTTTIYKELSVLDNAMIGHRVRTRAGLWDALLRTGRERRDEQGSRAGGMAALERVGLAAQAHLPAGALTQEGQKRVGIAMALSSDPKLLLLDEPAAGMNPEETVNLMALIRELVTGADRSAGGTQDEPGDGSGRRDSGNAPRPENRRGHARAGQPRSRRDRGVPGQPRARRPDGPERQC